MLYDSLWHPLDAESYPQSALLRPTVADNSSKARFPIDLPFRYYAGDQTGLSGAGRVVSISSVDVIVACRHQLKVGTPVELIIEWPARLDGRIPIHLVMTGRVMQSDLSGFAVGSCQHRFQLVGNPASDERHDKLIPPDRDNSLFSTPQDCAPQDPPATLRRLAAMKPDGRAPVTGIPA